MRQAHKVCVGLPMNYRDSYTCIECRGPNSVVKLKKLLSKERHSLPHKIKKYELSIAHKRLVMKYNQISRNNDPTIKQLRKENKMMKVQIRKLRGANEKNKRFLEGIKASIARIDF